MHCLSVFPIILLTFSDIISFASGQTSKSPRILSEDKKARFTPNSFGQKSNNFPLRGVQNLNENLSLKNFSRTPEPGFNNGNNRDVDSEFLRNQVVPIRDLRPPTERNVQPLIFSKGPSEQVANGQLPSFNGIELLPPLEIPPEFPIDDLTSSVSTLPGQNDKQKESNSVKFERQELLREQSFVSQGNSPRGASGNHQPQQQQRDQLASFGQRRPISVSDPVAHCLGTCNCPGNFDFVCGSNKILYQNDCALQCDKKCHPDIQKVDMRHCSRR